VQEMTLTFGQQFAFNQEAGPLSSNFGMVLWPKTSNHLPKRL
jgi:hypothetical protein